MKEMKRLTARNSKGKAYYPKCFEEPCNGEGVSEFCENCRELYDRCEILAQYEDTGLTPDQIREIDRLYAEKCREVAELQKAAEYDRWIPVEERVPDCNDYILLGFSNHPLPAIGRYEEGQEGGAFYLGDCDEKDTCISQNMYVNAWRPLPEPYRPEEE